MKIKLCSTCNEEPLIQTDELGMTYRLICGTCGKHTQDMLSETSTLENPAPGEATMSRLIKEWNDKN